MQDLGFGVQGLGFRVQGLGVRGEVSRHLEGRVEAERAPRVFFAELLHQPQLNGAEDGPEGGPQRGCAGRGQVAPRGKLRPWMPHHVDVGEDARSRCTGQRGPCQYAANNCDPESEHLPTTCCNPLANSLGTASVASSLSQNRVEHHRRDTLQGGWEGTHGARRCQPGSRC